MAIDEQNIAAQPIENATVKAVWERPTIESYDVADLTMGTGANRGEGLSSLS